MRSKSLKTLVAGLVLGSLVGVSSLAGAADGVFSGPFPPADGTGHSSVKGIDYTWQYTKREALEAAERNLGNWQKNNPGCLVVSRTESYAPVTLWNGGLSVQCTIGFDFEY